MLIAGDGPFVALRGHMIRSSLFRVLCTALAIFACACVSSGKYDAAVKNAEDAHAELLRARATDDTRFQDLQRKLADVQRNLDDATAEDARLRAEFDRLGTNADALLAEKGTLSSALGESRTRLEELRRAQAAAEARASLYRDLALRLKPQQ